jgi:hypothetical protein
MVRVRSTKGAYQGAAFDCETVGELLLGLESEGIPPCAVPWVEFHVEQRKLRLEGLQADTSLLSLGATPQSTITYALHLNGSAAIDFNSAITLLGGVILFIVAACSFVGMGCSSIIIYYIIRVTGCWKAEYDDDDEDPEEGEEEEPNVAEF